LMRDKLESVESPKLKRGKVKVFDPAGYCANDYRGNRDDPEWYLPYGSGNARITSANDSILPRDICVYSPSGCVDACDGVVAIDSNQFSSGEFKGWCVVARNKLPQEFFLAMKSTVLNPGCLHYSLPGLSTQDALPPSLIAEKAEVVVFHRNASALNGVDRVELSPEIFSRWCAEKIIPLYHFPEFAAPESCIAKILNHLRGTRIAKPISTLKHRLLKPILSFLGGWK
ncbi:MAG: hypothetical protein JXR97_03505, partial [Planctomycetes bacterium]|nr:hypothetical protein [Planctomycetota bacterium]